MIQSLYSNTKYSNIMIESLQLLSNRIIAQAIPTYKRFLYHHIDFEERLIGIVGARGVGKTTLLLQYIQEQSKNIKSLYIMADHPLVDYLGLFTIADEFQKQGGQVLIIDEIHKIKDFEIALKLIHDSFFSLHVIFTGSNAVALEHAKADLSRRAVVYHLPVMSFREYIEIETGEHFEALSLSDLAENHVSCAVNIVKRIKPLSYFQNYIIKGAYPFYQTSGKTYTQKLLQSSMQVLETDLPMIHGIDYDKINAFKKMLFMLAQSEPYDINISKLCGAVQLNQRTLYKYLGILQSAGLIRLLGAKSHGVSIISKPEKLYLDNTNLFFMLSIAPKKGTLRETFFASSVAYHHGLQYPKSGDFMVDDQFVFEIGGKDKSFEQIKGLNNAYVVSDDIEIGVNKKIPLWLFGFLY